MTGRRGERGKEGEIKRDREGERQIERERITAGAEE